MATKRKTALAALSFQLSASTPEIQLLPDGAFRATDGSGRPSEVPAWRVDEEIAARLVARLAAKPNLIVIDYEHQTLNKEINGQPAPAAGWFAGSSVEYRPGQGVFVVAPSWTDKAAAMIAAGEYKYISPVIAYDVDTGAVTDIRMAALSNYVGIAGMAEVALSAINNPTEEDSQVDLKVILKALGLPDTATEADATAALTAAVAKAGEVAKLKEQVAALTAKEPDPAQFVPVSTMKALQDQVVALTASVTSDKVGQLVDGALASGKLLPAQKDWAINLGKSNLAALTGYLDTAPAIAALAGSQTATQGGGGAEKTAALTAIEAGVAAQLGLTPEEFSKGKVVAA